MAGNKSYIRVRFHISARGIAASPWSAATYSTASKLLGTCLIRKKSTVLSTIRALLMYSVSNTNISVGPRLEKPVGKSWGG